MNTKQPDIKVVTLLHGWLVRLQFYGVVVPTIFMFAGLGIYSLGLGGISGLFFIGPILIQVLIGSWALVSFYRVFDDKSDPEVVSLFFGLAYVGLNAYLLIEYSGFAVLASGKFVPWILGVLGHTVVGVHWLILFAFRFRLPRRRRSLRVSRLPDRL